MNTFWKKGNSVYRWINALSLDVAAGACMSSIAVGKVFGVSLPLPVWLALGIVVWLIYTLDHLMDARNISHQANTFRHAIHQKYLKPIAAIALAVGLFSIGLVFFLPYTTFVYGAFLLVLVFIYFLLLKWMRIKMALAKELFIAFIYTSGIFVGPISLYTGPLHTEIYLLILQFFFLALINLLEFSFIERHSDQKDGHLSLVNVLGALTTKKTIWVIILIMPVLMLLTIFKTSNAMMVKMEWIVLLMWLTLVTIQSFTQFFSVKDRYRLMGDLIFIYPLLLII